MAELDPDHTVAGPAGPAGPVRPTTGSPLAQVLAAIDDANAADPTRLSYRGAQVAKEPLHAELMSRWLERLDPGADEVARIAARGHHVQRWLRPRSDYPDGRSGYLRWRRDAQRFHADLVAGFMRDAGYGEHDVDRVRRIICKQGLGQDPAVQTHEDALCLVFLETQLEATASSVGEDEMVRILARTLPKMSPAGVQAAAGLELGPTGAELLERAAEQTAEQAAEGATG